MKPGHLIGLVLLPPEPQQPHCPRTVALQGICPKSHKMCQLPKCQDEGDGLETPPGPNPSDYNADSPELGRKHSLMMCVGTLPCALTPVFSCRSPGAAPWRMKHQSFSTAGRFLDGQAPSLAVTLLQGIKPEK